MGLVPTMGALHCGHAALLERARSETDFVVVSIFVNPLQFDRKEDLEKYPRTMNDDAALCERLGAGLIFAPGVTDLYPSEQATFVELPSLTQYLCGQFRPGHFRGVATVVLKLLNIVQPDRAYFGQKDAQQLALIRRMVEDLNVPVEIAAVATVREPDGLALSSRNKLLTPEQRGVAPVMHRALEQAQRLIECGERSVESVRARIQPLFDEHPEARVEYFEVVDRRTITPVAEVDRPVLIAAAMFLGTTRLIDNVLAAPGSAGRP